MEITEIVKLILLLSSFIIMGNGVYTDIKERKYPNSNILGTIILGLFYGISSGHVWESLFGFLIINIFGVFLHKYNLMSSGDMKYLSTIFLFISIRNIPLCIILMIYMLIMTFLVGHVLYNKSNEEINNDLKQELDSYKFLLMYRINTFEKKEYKNKTELLKYSIPFTLPLYLAYILTVITTLIYTMCL